MKSTFPSLSFRFLQPSRSITQWMVWFLVRHPRFRLMVELTNTRVPADMRRAHQAVRGLGLMRRMSALPVGMLINELVRQMPSGHAFVNVGVWKGFTLFSGMADNAENICIGVDDFSQFNEARFGRPREEFLEVFAQKKSPAHSFVEMDYQTYLCTKHQGPIGLFLYDGNHEHVHQLRSMELAEPFLVPGSLIMVDDLNYAAARRAVTDFFWARAGQYEIVMDVPTAAVGHPTWWNGIMILRKR